MKEKILIITRNFPPLTGGMERLLWNVYDQLKGKYTITLIGPHQCGKFTDKKDTAIECDESSVFKFLYQAFIQARRASRSNNYAMCIAGSGVTAPVAVLISKLLGIPSIIYTHGLDLVTNNPVYQLVFIPFIRSGSTVIANSNNTARLAVDKGIKKEKIHILFPGVAPPENNCPDIDIKNYFNIDDKKILLIAGRLTRRKGITEFINNAFPDVLKQHPDTILILTGTEPAKSIKRTNNTARKIKEAVSKNRFDNNVIFTGYVDDKMLSALYFQSDLFIFPVIDIQGDVEGFGMVAIEAAAHGLPTIAFNTGGISDAIKDKESGYLVPPGDYNTLTRTINNMLNIKDINHQFGASCRNFSSRFEWNNFGKKLNEICSSTVRPDKTKI